VPVNAAGPWVGLAAIVTGASAGIGEELAVQLTRGGARVAIAARRADELERVAARCRAESPGAELFVIPCDVSDASQCTAMVADAVKRLGRLDVLVNNAGQGMWGRADEMKDLAVYEAMLRVNYLSVVWVTLAALPHLKATRGRILGVGSLSGKTGVPLRSGYAAAKHAMTGFLDTLRIELKEAGVSVTMIHPGFVSTGSQARNLGPDGRQLGQMPVKPAAGLTAEACARMLLEGGAARRRDVLPDFRARVAMWLKLIVPDFVDGMTAKAIRGRR
jgi:short-subunit dehydrogenase